MARQTKPLSDNLEASYLQVLSILFAYFWLKSARLRALSEDTDPARSLRKTILLGTLTVALLSYALLAISPANDASSFVGVTSAQIALAICVTGIPILIALRLASGTWLPFLCANLTLLAQSCTLVCALLFGALVLSSEPAGTDVYLLRNGEGEQTAAYKLVCGNLELSARTLVLATHASGRTRQVLADIDAIAALGPPSMEKAPRAMALLRDQLPRREAEMAAAKADLDTQDALFRRADADGRDVHASYGYLEKWWVPFWLLVAAGAVLLYAHVYKVARDKRSRWGSLAATAGAFLLSLVAYSAIVWFFTPPTMDVRETAETDVSDPAQARAAADGMDREIRGAINQLHRSYIQRAGYCPKVSRFGLW